MFLALSARSVGERDWIAEHCRVQPANPIGLNRVLAELVPRWTAWKLGDEKGGRERIAKAYGDGYAFDQVCDPKSDQRAVGQVDTLWRQGLAERPANKPYPTK
jgi:hypothetical protein